MTETSTPTSDELITPRTASERYKFAVGTFANWRSSNSGPAYTKRGGRVLYRVSEIEAWLAAGHVEPSAN